VRDSRFACLERECSYLLGEEQSHAMFLAASGGLRVDMLALGVILALT
jgi:hypothetical protein